MTNSSHLDTISTVFHYKDLVPYPMLYKERTVSVATRITESQHEQLLRKITDAKGQLYYGDKSALFKRLILEFLAGNIKLKLR